MFTLQTVVIKFTDKISNNQLFDEHLIEPIDIVNSETDDSHLIRGKAYAHRLSSALISRLLTSLIRSVL